MLLRTCAWMDTSSADTGSSATTSRGRRTQRTRQRDALALAARELVREPCDCGPGEPDQVEQLGHPLPPLGPGADPLDGQRLSQDRAHPHPRVQRRERVLEHELDVAAETVAPAPGPRAEVAAVDSDRSRCRFVETDDKSSQGGLAAAGLPDQAEVWPRRTSKVTSATAETVPAVRPNRWWRTGKFLTRCCTDRSTSGL